MAKRSHRRRSTPFTNGKARQAHKEKERITEAGSEWLAPRVAGRYADVSHGTLDNWRVACPLLSGEGIQAKPFPSAYGRNITYYLKADLDRVIAARARQRPIPEHPGLVYIEDAARELRVGIRTLRRLLAAHGVSVQEKTGKSKDGRPLPRSYVPKEFVEACKAERSLTGAPVGKMTVKEVATALGLTIMGVHSLIHREVLHAEQGSTATTARARPGVGRPLHYPRQKLLLAREEVERLKAKRGSAQPEPYTDAEGAWVPAVMGKEINPMATRSFLTRFTNQRCPQLDNEVLRAKPIRWPNGYTSNLHPRPLGFLVEQLKRLSTVKRGQPSPATGKTGGQSLPTPLLPDPEERSGGNRRRGRRKSKRTQQIYRRCYELLAAGNNSRRTILRKLREEFHEPAHLATLPKDETTVTIYARRWATDPENNLPWPVPTHCA